jgi:carboxyl-terminal processing protease
MEYHLFLKKNVTDSFVFIYLILIIIFSSSDIIYSQTSDQDIQIYIQAINEIEKRSLNPRSRDEIIRGSLKSYVKSLDPFSDYLTPEEYAAFKDSQKSHYAGVGMDIESDSSGQIICFPYSDGSAFREGIRSGDILESVDGLSVSQKSIYIIASKIRGKQGTLVELSVLKKDGSHKTFKINREAQSSKSVQLSEYDSTPVIQIFSFTPSTQRELKFVLSGLKDKKTIIIDLRDNLGGDFFAAIDSAMLFLEKGKTIVSIKNNQGIKPYESTTHPLNSDSSLFLLQNGQTASAAEFFIASLTKHHRAVSIGKKTFGKGTRQDIIELGDGSALFLTTSLIQTPDGFQYHKIGLEPSYALSSISPRTEEYVTKVKEITKSGNITLLPSDNVRNKPPDNEKKCDLYINCFNKQCGNEEEAKNDSLTVQNSLNNIKIYWLKENISGTITYFVCLGKYKDQKSAEENRIKVSQAMKADMFTRCIEKGKLISFSSRSRRMQPIQIKSGVDKVQSGYTSSEKTWGIRIGSYNQYDSVITAIRRIRGKDKNLPLLVQTPRYRKMEFEGVNIRAGSDSNYIVFIGPYVNKDIGLLNLLKNSGVITENDALWDRVRMK